MFIAEPKGACVCARASGRDEVDNGEKISIRLVLLYHVSHTMQTT